MYMCVCILFIFVGMKLEHKLACCFSCGSRNLDRICFQNILSTVMVLIDSKCSAILKTVAKDVKK